MDAAHFIHQAYLGMVWSPERIFIPSPSGRKRFNVLGALNPVTMEIVRVQNDAYINAESVCHMLCKLAIRRCGDTPITVVLDNAAYQRCEVVKDYAREVGIELLFLPSYSPNLNLIERLWKHVKKRVLYSQVYQIFSDFKEGIVACLENRSAEILDELESLLTYKFQDFSKVNTLPSNI